MQCNAHCAQNWIASKSSLQCSTKLGELGFVQGTTAHSVGLCNVQNRPVQGEYLCNVQFVCKEEQCRVKTMCNGAAQYSIRAPACQPSCTKCNSTHSIIALKLKIIGFCQISEMPARPKLSLEAEQSVLNQKIQHTCDEQAPLQANTASRAFKDVFKIHQVFRGKDFFVLF